MKYKRQLSITTFGSLCLLVGHAPSSAAAEQNNQQSSQLSGAEVSSKVVIRNEGYDARKDDTASRTVVSKEELTRYGDTSLLDALKRVPGISVSGKSVMMRGLGAGYTQILVDGERAPPGFSLDTLSPQSIERIEIIRSAVAEYSTQAIAGTVNVILTKKASSNQQRIRIGIGAANGYRWPGGSYTYSDKSQGVQSTLNIDVNESRFHTPSNFREDSRGSTDSPASTTSADSISDGIYRSLGGNGRITWSLGQSETLAWQTYGKIASTTSSLQRHTELLEGVSAEFPVIAQIGDSHEGSVKSEIGFTKSLERGKLEIKVSGAHAESRNTFQRNGRGASTGDTMRYQSIDANENAATVSSKLSASLYPGHAFAAGGEAGGNWSRQLNRQDASGTGAVQDFNFDEQDLVRRASYAIFAQDDWTVTPSFALYFGLRLEGIRTIVEPSGNQEFAHHSKVLSPIVQVLWKLPTENRSQIRGALAKTYKAPTTTQLTTRRIYSLNNSPAEPDQFGNPDLHPEIAVGFDAAYEYYWDKDYLLSLSFAHRQVHDYIFSTLAERLDRWVESSVNGSVARTDSVELELKVPLDKMTKLQWPIALQGSLSRNWSATRDTPGPYNRLADQIPLNAALRADYRGKQLNWGLYLGFQASSWSSATRDQLRYRSARRDTDAYVSWKDSSSGLWRVSLSNWLHQSSSSIFVFTGDGRTVRTTETPSVTRVRIQWETAL